VERASLSETIFGRYTSLHDVASLHGVAVPSRSSGCA